MKTVAYEIKTVWQHGDIEVQHHLEASDPRFEVRQAGALTYFFVATRAWQLERREAIEAAADLAGVPPPAPAAPAPAGPRPEKAVPTERIAPLILRMAEILYEENPAATHSAILERARAVVASHVTAGYKTFIALEEDVSIGVNRLHFDFEADSREKVVIYNRH